MQQIQYIKTNQLHESPMNPRKTFDQLGIDELAESIKQVGILQPIIARVNTQVKRKTFPIYEVICGSRRLTAAVVADLTEVPVIVRDLSDEEAFDLMITENLQRKDVKPLEEAFAFRSLIDKGTYDIDSLSLRFGKSPSYIRHRLKLNDLIPEFRELLETEIIGLSHALEISKLETKNQETLFEEDFKERPNYWHCPSLRDLKREIERTFTLNLSDAPFSLQDLTLDKKAGACTACPKNTTSNLLLFPDTPEAGLCLDPVCFKRKSDIHFERELKRIQEDEPGVILAYPSYVYGDDEKELKELVKQGVGAFEVSWKSGWEEVNEPELPEKPEESDFDEHEDYVEALADYEGEMTDYEQEVKEYQEKMSSGVLRKAFMLVGRDKGKVVYLEPRVTSNGSVSSPVADPVIKQIEELEAKDKRNQELTFEKLYNSAKSILAESGYTSITESLSEKEWTAIMVVMLASISDELQDEIYGDRERRYVENKLKIPAAIKLTPNQKTKVLRHWIFQWLNTSNPLYQISEAKALIDIAREKSPDQITQVELELQGKYLKRKEKIDQTIESLKSKSI